MRWWPDFLAGANALIEKARGCWVSAGFMGLTGIGTILAVDHGAQVI
jgi:hypothetical protein